MVAKSRKRTKHDSQNLKKKLPGLNDHSNAFIDWSLGATVGDHDLGSQINIMVK